MDTNINQKEKKNPKILKCQNHLYAHFVQKSIKSSNYLISQYPLQGRDYHFKPQVLRLKSANDSNNYLVTRRSLITKSYLE